MKKCVGMLWNRTDGYCALGAYARYLGASDEDLISGHIGIINQYRRLHNLTSIPIDEQVKIMLANDEGRYNSLRLLFKKYDIPLDIDVYDGEWFITNPKEYRKNERLSQILTHIV